MSSISNVTETYDWNNTFDHDFAATYIFTEDKNGRWSLILGYEPEPNYVSSFGGCKDGSRETALQTAKRELKEETADQLHLTDQDYFNHTVTILRKIKPGEKIGYMFLLYLPNIDFETLNKDISRAWRKETREVYREVSKICLIHWIEWLKQVELSKMDPYQINYIYCNYDNHNRYKLRDKIRDTMIWLANNY